MWLETYEVIFWWMLHFQIYNYLHFSWKRCTSCFSSIGSWTSTLMYSQAVSLKMSKSQRPPKTVQNESKLIDLVTRIVLTRAMLMPRFSNFLRNSIIHFRTCLYLVTCFLRVTVSFLYQLQGRTITSPYTNEWGINWNLYLWCSL